MVPSVGARRGLVYPQRHRRDDDALGMLCRLDADQTFEHVL
jgi:hypothetical protein